MLTENSKLVNTMTIGKYLWRVMYIVFSKPRDIFKCTDTDGKLFMLSRSFGFAYRLIITKQRSQILCADSLLITYRDEA